MSISRQKDLYYGMHVDKCLLVLADAGFDLLNGRPHINSSGKLVGRAWTIWHDELQLLGEFNTFSAGPGYPEKINALCFAGQFYDPQERRNTCIDEETGFGSSGTVYVRRSDLVDIEARAWSIREGLHRFIHALRASGYVPTGAWVDASFPSPRVSDPHLPQNILDIVNAGISVLEIRELAAHGK